MSMASNNAITADQDSAIPSADRPNRGISSSVEQDDDGRSIHYVSKNGNNRDGDSWESAWNELDQINWSEVIPGDLILIDGGEIGGSMVYTGTLTPASSGTEELPITIQLATAEGRNGKAVFFGGNSIPLPECGQFIWDESEHVNAGRFGIFLKDGVSNLTIDGTKRGGITIHGWREAGISFDPDRQDNQIDDNPKNITLRFMEIYNNGDIERGVDEGAGVDAEALAELYFPYHGSPGIKLSGNGHRFEYLEVHDNAADAIQSNFTSPENGIFNNIDNITVITSWFYNQRAHSGDDNSPAGEVCSLESTEGCDEKGSPLADATYFQYPAEPAGRQEAFNWCTHNDGIQIYSSDDLNGLALEQSVFGPNLMNALILGDREDAENSGAWVNNFTMNDVIVTRFTNNALGMNNDQPKVGSNWQINRSTVYGHFNKVNMGSFSLQSGSSQPEHRVFNTINVFGRSEFPDGNVEFGGNCEFNMYDGSLQGIVADPQFANVNLNVDYFENDLSVDFATVFTEDYRPQNPDCASAGSRLTSVQQLLNAFEQASKEAVDALPARVELGTEEAAPTLVVSEPTVDAPAVDENRSEPVSEPEQIASEQDEDLPASQPTEEIDETNADRQSQLRTLIILGVIAFFILILLAVLIYFLIRLQFSEEDEIL